jgi:hypothetical protein
VTLKKALIVMPHCYTMFRRGSTSSSNFSSDVIKTGSAETKAKTETDCTEDEAETKTKTGTAETKTAKNGLDRVSIFIIEFQTWQILCHVMVNPP